jgi:hypothetical protein
MSAFPRVESEDVDSSKRSSGSLFNQPWPGQEGELSHSGSNDTPHSNPNPLSFRSAAPGSHLQSAMAQGASSNSLITPAAQSERSWPELIPNLSADIATSHRNSHGAMDPAQLHQMEMQHLQRYGMQPGGLHSMQRPVPQASPQVLSHPQQLPGAGPALEHLLRPLSRDQLSLLQQQHSQQQAQQNSLPIPPSGPVLDQLLRMQQQQQQQLPPQVLLEQLLRQHQQTPFDHLHRQGSGVGPVNGLADQLLMRQAHDMPQPPQHTLAPRGPGLEQLFQARHQSSGPAIEQLLRQRQQEHRLQEQHHQLQQQVLDSTIKLVVSVLALLRRCANL